MPDELAAALPEAAANAPAPLAGAPAVRRQRTGPPPLPREGTGSLDYWKNQIEASMQDRDKRMVKWRENAYAYLDELKGPSAKATRVNIEFEKTEQKKFQLFYRLPKIKLRPSPRTIRDSYPTGGDGLPNYQAQPARDLKRAIAILTEALNFHAGPQGADTKALMMELLFDLLCPAGIACARVGYERYTSGAVEIKIGEEQTGNVGDVLGINPVAARPIMAPAPNIVGEKYYANRISPACLIVPFEFTGSKYDAADFLGEDYFVTKETATRFKWNLDGAAIAPNDKLAVEQRHRIVKIDEAIGARRTNQYLCRQIFYFPFRLGLDDNPDRIRRIVFVEGKKDPVVHEDYRDQRFDARNRFTGGIKVNPIRVMTTKYVSDLAYPPSDCTITRRASDELAEFRTQEMIHRRKAVPRLAVNVGAFPNDEAKQKFINGEHYGDIPVMNGVDLDRVAKPISTPTIPADNRSSEQNLVNDIDRAWALVGTQPRRSGGAPTATETSETAGASATRLGGEREIVLDFWLGIMRCFTALIQLYADRESYVEIAGEAGATSIEAWDRETVRGEFLFEVVPDSSLPPDAAGDRDEALNVYNLMANDKYTNGKQLARDTFEAYGRDPDRLTADPPAPPPPPPEKPKISLSINGKDLDPAAPQYANTVALLKALDIELPTPAPEAGTEDEHHAANVVDRERLRMATADEGVDQRLGGVAGPPPAVTQ